MKKKIILAYSGGLDTSIILKWLQENYNAEVVAYTADIGQKINKKKILNNAKKLGVKKIIIENLKDIFVKEYVYPMIRGHALYEGVYLLGTSIARPLIAKRQIAIAKKYKAYAVSHGSTGNNQDPGRVFKGKKMAGHMGAKKVTVQNLKILEVDKEKNILIVKGSVPGPENMIVYIKDSVKKRKLI